MRRLRDAWKNIVVFAWQHPWARSDRLGTFRRIISWQARSRLRPGEHVEPWLGDARLVVRRGMRGITGNLYYGLLEFADMAFFGHFLRSGDRFADIGANAGSYTVLAAKIRGAEVEAFEPAAETVPLLEANIEANRIAHLVTVHRVALGAEPGTAGFTSGLDAVNRFAEGPAQDAQTVVVRTADQVLGGRGITALKVDVEGAEDRVFAGARQLLGEPQLVAVEVETLAAGVREALEAAGFVERFYDPFRRELRPTPFGRAANNHLFVRDEVFVAERLRSAERLRYFDLEV